jgi:hypothetical protein
VSCSYRLCCGPVVRSTRFKPQWMQWTELIMDVPPPLSLAFLLLGLVFILVVRGDYCCLLAAT